MAGSQGVAGLAFLPRSKDLNRLYRPMWKKLVPPRHLYLFHHVPKTAGTTLSAALLSLGPSAIRLSFKCEVKKQVTERVEDELRQRQLKPRSVRAFFGHRVYFGLHQFCPHPPRYFTFLRSPVDRVVSHFRYHCTIAKDPGHPRHDEMRNRLMVHGEFVPVEVWFRQCYVQNIMVRFLAYAMHEEATHVDRPMGEADFEYAKQFLNHCWFVGLTEQSEIDIPRVCRAIGLSQPRERRNVSLHEVTSEQRATIQALVEEHEQFDLAIYRYGQQLRAAS